MWDLRLEDLHYRDAGPAEKASFERINVTGSVSAIAANGANLASSLSCSTQHQSMAKLKQYWKAYISGNKMTERSP
ncbi:hypothetical protein IBA8401_44620 [Pseudomonas syringae]